MHCIFMHVYACMFMQYNVYDNDNHSQLRAGGFFMRYDYRQLQNRKLKFKNRILKFGG